MIGAMWADGVVGRVIRAVGARRDERLTVGVTAPGGVALWGVGTFWRCVLTGALRDAGRDGPRCRGWLCRVAMAERVRRQVRGLARAGAG